jgi:hypothetical protein
MQDFYQRFDIGCTYGIIRFHSFKQRETVVELAHIPKRNGFALIAYNIFIDMDNQWLSIKELWDLTPSEAKTNKKRAHKRLQNAMSNGVERGLFVRLSDPKVVKYRIATQDHREVMLKQYYKKIAKHPSKQKILKQPRMKAALNGTSDLVAMLDKEIASTETRLARLTRMRKDALTL